GADHCGRCRRGHPRAFRRAVQAARRRHDGRHGKAAVTVALGHPASDVAYRRHYSGGAAARADRAVPPGQDAEGVLRAVSSLQTVRGYAGDIALPRTRPTSVARRGRTSPPDRVTMYTVFMHGAEDASPRIASSP